MSRKSRKKCPQWTKKLQCKGCGKRRMKRQPLELVRCGEEASIRYLIFAECQWCWVIAGMDIGMN